PIIAASTLKIPTAIHEQNAIMGRANRLLSRFVDKIALSFKPTKLLRPDAEARAQVTGIPVRDAVLAYRNSAYVPPAPGQRLLLLVFGEAKAHTSSLKLCLQRSSFCLLRCASVLQLCNRRARRISMSCAKPISRQALPRILRRSSATCRSASHKPNSSSPAPGPRPWLSLWRLAAPAFSCPYHTPLTTISLKTQLACKKEAEAGASGRASSALSASLRSWNACSPR